MWCQGPSDHQAGTSHCCMSQIPCRDTCNFVCGLWHKYLLLEKVSCNYGYVSASVPWLGHPGQVRSHCTVCSLCLARALDIPYWTSKGISEGHFTLGLGLAPESVLRVPAVASPLPLAGGCPVLSLPFFLRQFWAMWPGLLHWKHVWA